MELQVQMPTLLFIDVNACFQHSLLYETVWGYDQSGNL